ncbi:tryptophan halogenase [Sphingomonas sp. Leaf17]|uniref:tryptophan halogenase family protein n=1 Tax=Sphingomonas sp. Leaf17 TaxID=1735683 RepID=UPI0006F3FFE1|nr:tryptophan halogenase family protein [Sphingomonas sp. Leaf17]KQM64901.1 tryptophan halogenase [Sphingomonas sp. Leaf17]
MTETANRTIVIVGGGTAGWMAAAMLARFLEAGWTIRLVESDAIGTVGVGEATIPQIRLFNAALGIDEGDFLRATKGTIKLGIEFAGWTTPNARYMHGFGAVGRPLGLIGFHQYWLRANAKAKVQPFGDYAPNITAAYAGRHAPARGPTPLPYAYHFDAGLYAGYLRTLAEARGVKRTEGRVVAVDRDAATGDITAVTLDDQRRVAGDLFVDCTGFRALLLGRTLDVGFDDWSYWLPCDRAMAVPCARVADPVPYTRATARAAGWQWRIPLQHRTGNGLVYASAFLSDDEAAATLLGNLDGAALGDPRPIRFTAGKRRAFWSHNCIAIGLASGFLEPLESTSIHLVQTAIARLLQNLPGPGTNDAARHAYNRQTHREYDRIRDFLILHYHANRRDEPMWRAARAMALPKDLTAKLALWRERAQVSREDDELFTEAGWTQVLIGQDILPDAWHPLADQVASDDLSVFLNTAATMAARVATSLPAHADLLRALAAAPNRSLPA